MKTDRLTEEANAALDDDYHDPDDNEDNNNTYLSIQLHRYTQVQPQVIHYTCIDRYKHNRTQRGDTAGLLKIDQRNSRVTVSNQNMCSNDNKVPDCRTS